MAYNHWRASVPKRPVVDRQHPLNRDLLAAWLFWERGVEIFDDVATHNTLQLGTVWTGATVGLAGGCGVNSNGSSGYGIMTRVPKLGTGNFSIFAWINKTGTGARRGIVSYGDTSTAGGVNLYINSSDKLAFDLSNVGGPTSSSTIAAASWTMVGVTCTSGVMQLYVDYTADGSSSAMSPNILTNAFPGFIARDLSPAIFNGAISEVRIWGRALTPRDVFALWSTKYDEFRLPGLFGFSGSGSATTALLQAYVSMG